MPVVSPVVLLKQIIKRDIAKMTIEKVKLKIKKYLINLKKKGSERETEEQRTKGTKLENMVGLKPTVSVITLNVNGLNSKVTGYKIRQTNKNPLYFYILAQ